MTQPRKEITEAYTDMEQMDEKVQNLNIARRLNGALFRASDEIKTVEGQLYYYISGSGHEDVDDKERTEMKKVLKQVEDVQKQLTKMQKDNLKIKL